MNAACDNKVFVHNVIVHLKTIKGQRNYRTFQTVILCCFPQEVWSYNTNKMLWKMYRCTCIQILCYEHHIPKLSQQKKRVWLGKPSQGLSMAFDCPKHKYCIQNQYNIFFSIKHSGIDPRLIIVYLKKIIIFLYKSHKEDSQYKSLHWL